MDGIGDPITVVNKIANAKEDWLLVRDIIMRFSEQTLDT